MKRSVFIVLLTLFSGVSLFSQGDPWVPTVDQLVPAPASPEATAFAKYGKTPVSHYNGTPNISIPLAALSGRSYQLPISISYNASGIKVEQLAGNIGLGWNLSVGGMVTRQVNGLPDDYITSTPDYYPHYSDESLSAIGPSAFKTYYDYFLNNDMETNTHTSAMLDAYAGFLKEFEDRKVDTQPDIYSFQAPGLSGQFYIDYNTSVGTNRFKGVPIDGPEAKIEVLTLAPNGYGSRELLQITVTGNDGTRYIFDSPEVTEQKDHDQDGKERQFNSAWNLHWVYTANDRDVIEFQFVAGSFWTQEQHIGRGDVLKGIDIATADCTKTSTPSSSAAPTIRINQPKLGQINVNGIRRASFLHAQRLDVAGKTRLHTINLYKEDGNSQDRIVFDNNDYFVPDPLPSPLDEFDRRLKLNGLSFHGPNGIAASDPSQRKDYLFTYNETYDMDSRDSKAQDYWGFYNGEDANASLIPANAAYDAGTSFNGGDREPSESHMKTYILESITYPTGGSTEFFYQANRVIGNPVIDDQNSLTEVIYGVGGIDGADMSPNDPAGYAGCDDVTGDYPDIRTDNFTVTESDGYQFELDISTGHTPVDDVMHFYLYKGTAKSFCDLFNDQDQGNDDYIIYSYSGTSPTTINEILSLDSRQNYHMLVVSNSVDVDYKVYRQELVPVPPSANNNIVGGLRVYKVVDKPDATSIASTRYFYYDDLSTVAPGTTLNDAFFSASNATSGVLHQPVSMIALAQSEEPIVGEIATCDFVNRLSSNRYRAVGGIIGYTKVTELSWHANQTNGYTVHEFHNTDRSTFNQSNGPSLNGRVKDQKVYNSAGALLSQTAYDYQAIALNGVGGMIVTTGKHGNYDLKSTSTDGTGGYFYTRMSYAGFPGSPPTGCDTTTETDCLKGGPQNKYVQSTYSIGEGWLRLNKTTQTTYDGASPLVKITENDYETTPVHFQPVTIQTTEGDQQVYTTYLSYPDDLADPYMTNLVDDNRTAEIVEIVEYKGSDNSGIELRRKKTSFQLVNGTDVYPHKLSFSQKGESLEDRIEFVGYDAKGNPLEIKPTDGTSVAFVWGYGNRFIVARVVNATQADVDTAMGGTGYDLGTGGLSSFQITALKAISGAQVMTMTYDPTYGITSQTDPNGKTTTFEYDDFGRLKLVRDFEGNIISKNEYHLKGISQQ